MPRKPAGAPAHQPVAAIVYKLNVSEGYLSALHGFLTPIMEVYIPSLKIAFNTDFGKLHVITEVDHRYDDAKVISKISVNPALVYLLSSYLDAEEKISKYSEELLVKLRPKSRHGKKMS
ncbi:MAG: hypothetical protein JRN21_09905 [Nitrososphaerota archaeon]|nr:hypothetical protein [Nitrososphaerota archaeon]